MGKQIRTIELVAPGTRTSSFNSADTNEVLSDGPGVLYLNISAVGGTPTLDIILQAKDPVSGAYFTVAAIPQQTGTGVVRYTTGLENLPDAVYRANVTIGGSTPSFTFSLSLVAKDRG